jgi:arsenical pump membrane protein
MDYPSPISSRLLKICFAVLIAIDVSYVFASLARLPVSLIILSGAVFLILVFGLTQKSVTVDNKDKRFKHIVRQINWDIILFMLCIFIVVQGLETAGVVEFLSSILLAANTLPSILSVFIPSIIITIGASFMNNWPMTILGLFSIEQAVAVAGISGSAATGLIFSNVIGNNLGPHFFPLGSLAILMWLETMRRKGVHISLKDYLKIGAILSIVEVIIASLVLWAELNMGLTLNL